MRPLLQITKDLAALREHQSNPADELLIQEAIDRLNSLNERTITLGRNLATAISENEEQTTKTVTM